MLRARAHLALILAGSLLLSPHAVAEDKVAAEALFDQGRALMAEGKYAEACERFARSDALDSASGTLLNLAECQEKVGKTASAWASYRRAVALARSRGQKDREQLAAERAAALEPELARLEIDVPSEARIAGLVIRRAGSELDRAAWGVPVPVDPGAMKIEASAPGRRSFVTELSVSAKQAARVTIPLLEPESSAAAEPPSAGQSPAPSIVTSAPAPATADTDPGGDQRMLGYVVGGVGLVGLAIGTGFALSARSKHEDSKSFCRQDDEDRCSAEGVALRDDARSAGVIATIAFGAGLAALAGGTVLVITAPSSGQGAALSLGGTF